MSKKLIIFGGSGFVGGNLTDIARRNNWEVFIADSRPGVHAAWLPVDITNAESVKNVFAKADPDAAVNVAAIADVDLAEQKKDLAYQVNVAGARSVAENCAERGIPYVYFSSDAVFDGEKRRYTEEDEVGPTNYYGLTKMEAEKAVFLVHPRATVIRISLVLGYPVVSGNSFFANLENKLKEGKEILTPTYEIRTPVDVVTLSECVLELCQNGYSGLLHIGSTDSISRFDLSRKLATRMGFDDQLIQPQSQPEHKPGRAPRHKNGIISVAKAQRVLKTRLLSIDETIQRAFAERPAPDGQHPPSSEKRSSL
jgi:dTDP-4-dehydrorhamnose reductase